MKNLYKIILGIVATGTVATVSAVTTTKIIENKKEENIMTKQVQSTSIENQLENTIENKNVVENITENISEDVVKNTSENSVQIEKQNIVTDKLNTEQNIKQSYNDSSSKKGKVDTAKEEIINEEKNEKESLSRTQQFLKEKMNAKNPEEVMEIYKKYYGDSESTNENTEQ